MRWICLVFLLNVFGTYSLALDNYKFRLLDVSEGLSDDQIRSLSMVPDGRMAIRTASILNIYNGSTFRHYYYDKVSLVKRALVSVEKNMDNADYTIEDLGRDLGLSRAHLNRKLQSIVELTPLQFIRSIRLKRAAQLLQDSQYNVAEIADMVGFNTLRYFNKYFKDEFHMTPTQYREEHKNKA